MVVEAAAAFMVAAPALEVVVVAALEEEVAAAITSVAPLRLRLSGSPQPQPRNGWLNRLTPLSGLHRLRSRALRSRAR